MNLLVPVSRIWESRWDCGTALFISILSQNTSFLVVVPLPHTPLGVGMGPLGEAIAKTRREGRLGGIIVAR
jgi:hypothetical protein